MKVQTSQHLPRRPWYSELLETALIVVAGLALAIVMIVTSRTIRRLMPGKGAIRQFPGFR